MLTVNFTGMDQSLFLVGMANVTDILWVSMSRALMAYQSWLFVLTAVLMVGFLYTRNLLLAVVTIIALAVNMYVFQYSGFSAVTWLTLRAIFLLLIAFVAVFQLYEVRKRNYGH
jgi:hypothetical protein